MSLTEQNRTETKQNNIISFQNEANGKIDSEYKKILFFGYFLAWIISCAGVYKFYSGAKTLGINLVLISLIPLYLTGTDKIHFIYNPWIKVTAKIGEFIQKLFLMLFFYILLLPLSILMKIFKGDFLHKNTDKKSVSFWIDYIYSESPDQSKENYENYNMFSLFFEYWRFLMLRKKYWLLPLILMLILMGIFILFVQGSAISPFIYTIF